MEEIERKRGRKPKSVDTTEHMEPSVPHKKREWVSPFSEFLAEHFGRPACVCGKKETEWKLKREFAHEVTKYVMLNRHKCVCDNCAR